MTDAGVLQDIALFIDTLVVIVTEDVRAFRLSGRSAQADDQILTLSTADLLAGLEAAGRINSAEEVYRRAEDAGRYASRLQTAREENARGLAAVRRLLDSGD